MKKRFTNIWVFVYHQNTKIEALLSEKIKIELQLSTGLASQTKREQRYEDSVE